MRLLASALALAMLVAVTIAVDCSANSSCRGGTCINGKCAPFSGTGGPCDEAADCLYGNTCDSETKKCKVPCPGQVNCGSTATPQCKTVSSDNQNCGACGNSCPTGKGCVGGQCLCNSGTLNCGNTCVDPSIDVNNCGSCGNKCGQHGVCIGGVCSCSATYGNCYNDYNFDGCETYLNYNSYHCSSCRNNCGQRAYCDYQACACYAGGYGNCNNNYNSDGCEVVFATDDTYCGSCGANKNCGGSGNTDSTCSNYQCGCSNPNYANCDFNYATNGCETNIKTDDTYCGGCGFQKNCGGSGNTDSYCNSGSCACSNANYRNCYNGFYDDGCETDITSTDNNCGSCGNYCGGLGNTDSTCNSGSCGCSNPNYANCYNGYSDGCETNIQISDTNCGSCGTYCGGPSGFAGDSTCNSGQCACSSSFPNYKNCDGNYALNGCEVNTNTDNNNCGSCGYACGANAQCNTGSCQCNFPFGNCDGSFGNGCETAYLSDNNNCGSCGNACGANAQCNSGQCQCSSAAFGNCKNGYAIDGCETTFATDDTYCGSCGTQKNCGGSGNTDSTCSNGYCGCSNANYRNCNYNYYSDGCEIDITTSDTNCGACGTYCGGLNVYDSACSSGSCACPNPTQYGNCDNNFNNGCETTLATDDTYCGSCGANKNCGGSGNTDSYCSGGSCACQNAGYRNCNGNYYTDGCEAYVPSDKYNCGACGTQCYDHSYCQFSYCFCDKYYADCDDADYNGCEVYLSTDPNNCGYCGTPCNGAGYSCANGSCTYTAPTP